MKHNDYVLTGISEFSQYVDNPDLLVNIKERCWFVKEKYICILDMTIGEIVTAPMYDEKIIAAARRKMDSAAFTSRAGILLNLIISDILLCSSIYPFLGRR